MMFTNILETTAELMTSRRQHTMTLLFLLLTFGLHRTTSYVDVSRQNNVIVVNDDNNDDNNNTGEDISFCNST